MSASANTASLASLKQFSAGVYGERRFMLAETSMYTAAFGLPTSSGNFALLTDYFGYSDYNQSEISIAYARKLANNIDIGAAINYYGIRIPGYGNASAFHFQLGSVFHINERLHTGIQIYNPLGAAIGKQSGLKLASVYSAGIGYEWSDYFLTSLEVIKEQEKKPAVHAGLQYKPIIQVTASAGYVSDHNQFYFGVGYSIKQFKLDLSAAYHQYIGVSPGLMLVYQFKPREVK